MPAQGRLGDQSEVPSDSHGCPACAHSCIGPAVAGSPDVNVNGKPALRIGDPGVHSSCCGANEWAAKAGAPGVFINGIAAHRLGDAVTHCGGMGKLVEGSPDVFVGDFQSSGPPPKDPLPEPIEVTLSITDPFGNPMVTTVFDAKLKVNGVEEHAMDHFIAHKLKVEQGERAEIELFAPQG